MDKSDSDEQHNNDADSLRGSNENTPVRQSELGAFIRYQISKMRARNEHHRFEDLCRAFSRQRIARNIIPATGPVSAGGDQGRDFETFLSYIKGNIQPFGIFLGIEDGNRIVFCCSLQQSALSSKIMADVQTICGNPGSIPVDAIVYFTEADVSTSLRHRLTDTALGDYGVQLSIIDGGALAESLSEPENVWIPVEYLNLSLDLLDGSGLAREAGELFATGDIIVRSLNQLDPIRDLGIHSPMTVSGWSGLPDYVTRSIDTDLDAHFDGGMIVIEGGSASGKTRSAYEAMLRNMAKTGERPVVIPKDGRSLRRLIAAGYKLDGSIIWLDDVEKYIGLDGIDEGIARLFTNNSDVLFLATLRSRAKAAMELAEVGSSGRSLASISHAVLSGATTLRIARHLDSSERKELSDHVTDPRIAAALSSEVAGFAEYIAAAPATLSRWQDGRDGSNEIGAALVSAAVDLRRAGYLSPIPREWLEAMCVAYLDPRIQGRTDEGKVDAAFSWATQMVRGASSCLETRGQGLYSPFDYLVDFVQREGEEDGKRDSTSHLRSIPDLVWHGLRDRVSVDDPSFMSCVSISSLSLHPGLKWYYDRAVTEGRISSDSLKDPRILLNFVRSCVASHMCIVCQASVHDLDIGAILAVLLDECSPVLNDPKISPTRPQVESIHALASMGEDANLRDPGAPLHEAALLTSPEKWTQVGEFLQSVGLSAGRYWVCFAEKQQGKNPRWPISLTKARMIRSPGDRGAPGSK
ncbi:hypothetical protein [Streptomyces sp. N50]|uniref:hypothetical protein n=1 Tax=Streptomyces sp. N50 TaxID=3081765 RepID=UPI002961FCD2|nr:hypothetical protein [Streptomyces sp. N50]WOX12573.1 hypothetical protein R2B38_28740 [Streptomyces sp. N50]